MPQMGRIGPDAPGSGDGEATAMPGMATGEHLARPRDAAGSEADSMS